MMQNLNGFYPELLDFALKQTLSTLGLHRLNEATPLYPITLPNESSNVCGKHVIKREDLRHPYLSGNKWHKLKYALGLSIMRGGAPIISFGGSFSNHLHALAAAGAYLNIATTGLVRATVEHSPTLNDAHQWGMQTVALDRSLYRFRAILANSVSSQFWASRLGHQHWMALQATLPGGWSDSNPPLVVPEGGSSLLGLLGVADLARETLQQSTEYNHWVVACGTGITLAGLVAGLYWAGYADKIHVTGISVLRGERFLEQSVAHYLRAVGVPNKGYRILHQFNHGGYAKQSPVLRLFQKQFAASTAIDLDPIYTVKVLFAIDQLSQGAYWAKNDRILAFHTGGLQGTRSYVEC